MCDHRRLAVAVVHGHSTAQVDGVGRAPCVYAQRQPRDGRRSEVGAAVALVGDGGVAVVWSSSGDLLGDAFGDRGHKR